MDLGLPRGFTWRSLRLCGESFGKEEPDRENALTEGQFPQTEGDFTPLDRSAALMER